MKLAGAMTTATQSMTAMNKTMKPEQLSRTMQEFGKASTHMEMTEEMMSDALDDILNESGDEEAGDSIVQQVLDEIGIDISSKVTSYSMMDIMFFFPTLITDSTYLTGFQSTVSAVQVGRLICCRQRIRRLGKATG